MLRRASACGALLVAGLVPGLPFPDCQFDGVAASLVVSHCDSFEAALRDMVRVLKPGGRLGVTAGAQSPDPPNLAYQIWVETAEAFVGPDTLLEASRRVIPWEAWLREADHVTAALTGTGLAGVVLHELAYPVTMSPDDYLAMLDVFLYGRVVRYRLGAARWRAFKKRVAEKLHAREVTRVEYIARFHLGVGRRPE